MRQRYDKHTARRRRRPDFKKKLKNSGIVKKNCKFAPMKPLILIVLIIVGIILHGLLRDWLKKH